MLSEEQKNNLYESAKLYLNAGWSIVPLRDYKKGSTIEWDKYKTEKPTIEDVDNWFEFPNITGLAVVTGKVSNLTVIDDDFYVNNVKLELNSNLESKTVSGGRHLYFKYSAIGNSNAKSKDEHKLELQEDGKLIVLPPSFARNKQKEIGQYTWTVRQLKSIEDLRTLDKATLPIEIIDPKDYTPKNLLELVNAPLGTQHHNLRDLINTILWRFKPEEWSELAIPAIKTAAASFDPPHPLERVDKLIHDCMKWNLEKRLEKKEKEKTTIQVPKTMNELALARIEERKLEAIAPNTGYKYLDTKIKGWIPGHLYVLTGETNAGKTACACNFSYRVEKQKKKVLYFALEPDVGVIEYMAGIYHRKVWTDIKDEDLLSVDTPGMTVFTKESHSTLDQLISTIENIERQDLIVVDHIGYFTSNPKDKRSQVQQESDAIKRIVGTAKKKGTAIMIIAHPRKGNAKSKSNTVIDMNDISGSAAFKQDATDILIIHMNKEEDDHFKLTNSPDGFILLPKVKTGTSGSIKIRFVPNSSVMLDESEIATVNYNQAVTGTAQSEMEF
jgi:archaellum biogenesis ATPase FlaH